MINNLVFHIWQTPDHSAGILGFHETVTINLHYGEPKENLQELIEFWRQNLSDYYDTPHIETQEEYVMRTTIENKIPDLD